MKSIKEFMLTLAMVICAVSPAFGQQPQVLVGSESFECIIEDSRTYIPMRAVFEELGYTVNWLPDDKAVVLEKDDTELTLYTKTNTVTGYGTLRNKVVIVNDRTYLPFRELLNLLGYEVEWDADTKTAIVVLPDAETTTEITTVITSTTTTEAATETTTDIIYDNNDLYVGDTPVGSKQELVNAVLNNIKNKRPDIDELIAMVSVDEEG